MTPRFHFRYSRVFEDTVANMQGEALTPLEREHGRATERSAQALWDVYEGKALQALGAMYRLDPEHMGGKIWISLRLPNSFSDPPTITLKNIDLDNDPIDQKTFISRTVHELAHYYLYTQPDSSYANQLFQRIGERNLVGSTGANVHYFVQAVEFGIMGDLFGQAVAAKRRQLKAEKAPDDYRRSAQLLIEHRVPLDRHSLEFIEREVLAGS